MLVDKDEVVDNCKRTQQQLSRVKLEALQVPWLKKDLKDWKDAPC